MLFGICIVCVQVIHIMFAEDIDQNVCPLHGARLLRPEIAILLAGEDSLSHHVDYDVGLSIIDRFTYYLLEFLQGVGPGSKATMQDLINHIR